MVNKTNTTKQEEFHFENSVKEIEKLVQSLESGQFDDLETLMANYEKGSVLIKKCYEYLDQAEIKIQKITNNIQNEKREDESR